MHAEGPDVVVDAVSRIVPYKGCLTKLQLRLA